MACTSAKWLHIKKHYCNKWEWQITARCLISFNHPPQEQTSFSAVLYSALQLTDFSQYEHALGSTSIQSTHYEPWPRSVVYKHLGRVSCVLLCIVLFLGNFFLVLCFIAHHDYIYFFIKDSLFSAWFKLNLVVQHLPTCAWGQTFASLMVFEGNENEKEPLFFNSSAKTIGKARQNQQKYAMESQKFWHNSLCFRHKCYKWEDPKAAQRII